MIEALIFTAIGLFGGWHFHKAYVRRLYRIVDSMQAKIKGR